MKKRVLSMLLVLLLVLGLVGCGQKGEANESTSSGTTETPAKEASKETSSEVVEEDIDWPTKTVEVVIHAGAGGDTDFNTRTMAKYFEKITGESMVVTNMTGGGGSVSTSFVKEAEPDGYTMLCTHTGPMVVNEVSGLIEENLLEAFEIANVFAEDKGTVLVTSAESGITSIEDLIEMSKAEPGSVIYGSELGGYSHLQGLMIQNLSGIEMKIVDTGSTSDKIVALLGGRIDLGAIAYGSVMDYEKTGELVVLAQFGGTANEYLSDIPTFTDYGIELDMNKPYIAAFPKGTDPRIVEKFDSIIAQIVEMPEYKEDLKEGFNQPVDYWSQDEAMDYLSKIREDFLTYSDLLRN